MLLSSTAASSTLIISVEPYSALVPYIEVSIALVNSVVLSAVLSTELSVLYSSKAVSSALSVETLSSIVRNIEVSIALVNSVVGSAVLSTELSIMLSSKAVSLLPIISVEPLSSVVPYIEVSIAAEDSSVVVSTEVATHVHKECSGADR